MSFLQNDMVVLAGTREVRVVRSTLEAESAMAGGFRPEVVLLGPGVHGPAEFATAMRSHPSRARIPVLAVSGGAGPIRLTLVSQHEEVAYPGPDELPGILQVLDDLCSGSSTPGWMQ